MSRARYRRAGWLALALSALAVSAEGDSQRVEITLHWDYRGVAAPMKVYAVAPGKKAVLWETGNVDAVGALPLGEDLTDRPIAVSRGGSRRLVLVYRNETDAPIYFFAAPHHTDPEESALGFKFKCLCVNHAFEAKPHGFWYRVVELRLDQNFAGETLGVSHTIIGIDRARRDQFSDPAAHPDG